MQSCNGRQIKCILLLQTRIVALIIFFNYATPLRCHERRNSIKHEVQKRFHFCCCSKIGKWDIFIMKQQQRMRKTVETFSTYAYSSIFPLGTVVPRTPIHTKHSVQDANKAQVGGRILSIALFIWHWRAHQLGSEPNRGRIKVELPEVNFESSKLFSTSSNFLLLLAKGKL